MASESKFKVGRTVVTAGVDAKMHESKDFSLFVGMSFGRYIRCDWGDTCEEDKASNDYAVENGERILAEYKYKEGTSDESRIWIITEWDRSVTTVLFPEEY